MARCDFRESRGAKAFTLIELLVVVSIIALLVSILLPALNMARRQAKEVVCATNLHSLFSFINLYASDYEGWYPDLAVSPISGNINSGVYKYCPYRVQGDWRKYALDEYGLERKSLYSPTNIKWESDFFYYGETSGDKTAQNQYGTQDVYGMVIGYMYFGSPKYQAADVEFRRYLIDPQTETYYSLTNPPDRVFPRRISEKGKYDCDFLFTDLNRQYPYNVVLNNWVTPDDPDQRWGSNHLYEMGGWPKGSHVANRDGSVTWTAGEEVKLRNLAVWTGSATRTAMFW